MRALFRHFRESRAHKKQARYLDEVLKRVRRRKLADRPGFAPLEEAVGKLRAAIRAGELRKAESLEKDATKLIEAHFPGCAKASLVEQGISLGWAVLIALAIRTFVIEPFQIPTGSMIPTLQVGDHIFVNKLAYSFRLPLINLHLVHWSEPRRGDIVIFPYPVKGPDFGKDYIKRVVGLPGDRLRLEGNVLSVNGERVPVDALAGGLPCMDSLPDFVRCDTQVETLGPHTFISQHHRDNCPNPRVCSADWPLELKPPCLSAVEGQDCHYFGDRASNPDWPEVVIPADHFLMMGDNRDNSSDGRYWGLVPRQNILGRAMFIWWSADKRRLFESIL